MTDRHTQLFRYVQLAADLVVLVFSFFFAGALRFDDLRVENQEYYNYYVQLFVFMILAWVVVSMLLRSHRFYPGIEIRRSMGGLLNTLLIHAAILALLLVSLKGYYYSRLFFTYFYLCFVPLVLLLRMLIIGQLRKFLSKESNAQPVLLLGYGAEAQEFATMVSERPELGLRIVAWFGTSKETLFEEELAKAKVWIKTEKVAEIYCALPPHLLADWVKIADANLLRFRYLPPINLQNIGKTAIQLLGDVAVLVPRKEPLAYTHNKFFKRIFDVVFSAIIILLVFPIFLPVVAILIKLDTRGKVFFKQQRTGLNNKVFTVYKFRTMVANATADTQQATINDARITRVGKFLRRHNLDEMPQFVNVLIGHMSVVGPRPHMLNHTESYRAVISQFMVRHFVKPGITGLAQTRGLRGETPNEEDMRHRVKADVYYIENWSLLLDFKIIFDTVLLMITGRAGGK